jgi:hypothetical protein
MKCCRDEDNIIEVVISDSLMAGSSLLMNVVEVCWLAHHDYGNSDHQAGLTYAGVIMFIPMLGLYIWSNWDSHDEDSKVLRVYGKVVTNFP